MRPRLPHALLCLTLLAAPAQAAGRPFLRPLSPDRPDRTESPVTVEPFRWQVEADLLSWTGRPGGDDDERRWLTTNLKLGLTPALDLHLVFEPLVRRTVTEIEGGLPVSERETEPGDLGVRVKLNLWGNDGGTTAAALLPYVSAPLEGGETTLGVLAPLGVSLPGEVGLGLMAGGEALTGEDYDGISPILSATVSRAIAGPLAAFVELWAAGPPGGDGDWQQTFDAGLTWDVTPSLRLDGGVYLTLDAASADERTFFLGFTGRR